MKNIQNIINFLQISSVLTAFSFICVDYSSFLEFEYASVPTNDSYRDDQWAIDKISLPDAWHISTGSDDVRVCVIDSGIEGTHEDLLGNINSSLSTCVSPYYTTGLEDNKNHGTPVAGIIGAVGNNSVGITGVCWDVDLISVRVAGLNNNVDGDSLDDAFDYAGSSSVDAPIINMSIAGPSYTTDFLTSIFNYDGLIVCAAGNYPMNIDLHPMYPASFIHSNILSVGATDEYDNIRSDSNYGAQSVDLFAPGDSIYSTNINNSYSSNNGGTSFAAPYVAGVAALLKSINPDATTSELKSAIVDNVDAISSLSNLCVSGGRLNAYKSALAIIPLIQTTGTTQSFGINKNSYRWIKMSVVSGHYSLSVSGLVDCDIELYSDVRNSPLISSSFNSNQTHSISFTSTQSKTIYAKIINNDQTDKTFTVSSSYSTHQYNDRYLPYNTSYHKSVCECNDYVLQSHIFTPDVFLGQNVLRCVLCNTISFSNIGINTNYIINQEDVDKINDGLFNDGIVESFKEGVN